MRGASSILVAGLACASCAGPGEFLWRPESRIGWPPGDAPRIEVAWAYHSTNDVRRHVGFWSRIVSFVAGAETHQLVSPYGLAMSDAKTLFVADPGRAAVHRLDLESGEHAVFTGGSRDRILKTPVGVAVAGEELFVTDSTLGRVVVLDQRGRWLRSFGSSAELGRPTGIAFDAGRNRLLIVDTTGGRILAYGLDGRALAVAGKRGGAPGEFNFPTNIAVTKKGEVLVTDSLNFRIQVLSPDLNPVRSFGVPGRGPGTFASPKGVAVDSDGHVYVVDGMFDNIQIFDPRARLLLAFGSHGSGLGGLYLPTAIMIDEQNRVFVSDSGNARIQVFQYHPSKS